MFRPGKDRVTVDFYSASATGDTGDSAGEANGAVAATVDYNGWGVVTVNAWATSSTDTAGTSPTAIVTLQTCADTAFATSTDLLTFTASTTAGHTVQAQEVDLQKSLGYLRAHVAIVGVDAICPVSVTGLFADRGY